MPQVPPPAAAPRAEAFAAEVTRQLEGPVLRQSRRRALLKAARGMGIGRFEANLIIAAVQHHRPSAHPVESGQTESGVTSSRARLAPFAVVLIVQAAIAWGAWRVLFG
jgi:hypothetical protein